MWKLKRWSKIILGSKLWSWNLDRTKKFVRNKMSEIKIKLPKVFEILSPNVKKRYKCLKGGRASGKSWGAVLALFYISTTYKTFICCVREIQKSIKESSQKLIVDTIKRYGLEDEFYITKTEITHKITGSRFIFFGIKSNPESVKSLEGADIVWVEEADRVSQESWDLLIPTVRKEHSQIWPPITRIFLPTPWK